MNATETQREADFRACPILRSYLSTLLEDAQNSESEEACMEEREPRDAGTIYTLNEADYQRHKADCVRFCAENVWSIDQALKLVPGEEGLRSTHDRYMTPDRIGSTFYMVRVGHGVGFTDDGDAACLERLDKAAQAFGGFDSYFGDDGKLYTA